MKNLFFIKFTVIKLNPKYKRTLNNTIATEQITNVKNVPSIGKISFFNINPKSAVGNKKPMEKVINFLYSGFLAHLFLMRFKFNSEVIACIINIPINSA